jgi:16S rRNA (guanine966-N2)-methyltransferase
VLDLFAGTGATGIEALSRGALLAVFVDMSHVALAAVHENLERAKVADRATVVPAQVSSFLARADAPDLPFDLVFVDPPYEVGGPDLTDVMAELAARWLPGEDWTVVLTRGRKSSTPVIPLHWLAARELRYGDSLLTLYRPNDRPRNLGV